jgi:hypothetical protein
MFSPLAFPSGMIIYDLTTSLPPPSHLALSPFEIHRQPLAIVAIADGAELDQTAIRAVNGKSNGNGPAGLDIQIEDLEQELVVVKDQYPKALVHRMLIFDLPASTRLPEDIIAVPPQAESKITTMKTVMCDISSVLLAELTTLAKSFQGMKSIDSPNQNKGAKESGYSWPTIDDAISKRNSQLSLSSYDSTTESSNGKPDRRGVRMSMPAQFRATTNSRSNSMTRPMSPMDEQKSGSSQNSTGDLPSSKPNSIPNFKEHSRDRISVQGFGSNSTSEMSRNKGKGRIGITIGSLYLQAGRWGDALRELIEGATIAKVNGDHLWHAKALESIVISMMMLAWAGLDFQIPEICYTASDQAPYHSRPTNKLDQPSPTSSRLASLHTLSGMLPELLSKILNLYDRASNRAGESLPQLPFSENAIRFSKLLTAIHLGGGKLDDDVLQLVVSGKPFLQRANVEAPRLNIHPTRSVIVATLFRAFPSTIAKDDLSLVDHTIILGGIAAVLGDLGYQRKKAMVMRELVSIIVPGLIQARVVGAAEVGIHPAAGLAALNSTSITSNGVGALELGEGDTESGVDELLSLVGRIYGVVGSTAVSHANGAGVSALVDDSNEAIAARIVQNARLRSFGGQNLKMNVLRACISLAEALPDFQSVLRLTADLLRTAGSGVAPGPRSDNVSPAMQREEQMRLAINISRTVTAGKKLGLQNLGAEYWDEFLVRRIDLEPPPPSRNPIPHRGDELGGPGATAKTGERNPFIYNPFLRRPDVAAGSHLLVTGEAAIFKVTLQNPYEFDIEIETLRLESEGIDFTSGTQTTVIGPYRTQILSVSGTPEEAGSLTITGCVIKVRGCRERRFPIFSDPWSPQIEFKIKSTGLASSRVEAAEVAKMRGYPQITPPTPSTVAFTAIAKQPVLVVKSCSLSQSAAMVLEGERQIFLITLQNLSTSTPADLLLFSFQDSTQAPLQTALSNRDASPAELYEYELILSRKQALRWVPQGDDHPHIAPGGLSTFEFELLGKPGLTNCIVQVDYACLGVPRSDVEDKFYTRQVSLPLTVTVNASLELARMDVLPLTGDVPNRLWTGECLDQEEKFLADDFCLLVLDLRNAWPNPLNVHLEVGNGRTVEEDVLPGSTSRIIVPVRRMFLDDPFASIPTLDPSSQRQFVVSSGKISADTERNTREAFWYREQVLKMLKGSWKTTSGPDRSGEIELRGIRLTPRMVDALKIEDVEIDLSIENGTEQSSKLRQEVDVDEFLQLRARVTNRTGQKILPMIRLQPTLRNHTQSLDLSKKLVWDGTLQHTLPMVPSRGSVDFTIGLTALCRGQFEISASVEEVKLIEGEGAPSGEASGKRPRANTRTMMDAVLGLKERRIWHSREPCRLAVRDEESSSDDE